MNKKAAMSAHSLPTFPAWPKTWCTEIYAQMGVESVTERDIPHGMCDSESQPGCMFGIVKKNRTRRLRETTSSLKGIPSANPEKLGNVLGTHSGTLKRWVTAITNYWPKLHANFVTWDTTAILQPARTAPSVFVCAPVREQSPTSTFVTNSFPVEKRQVGSIQNLFLDLRKRTFQGLSWSGR